MAIGVAYMRRETPYLLVSISAVAPVSEVRNVNSGSCVLAAVTNPSPLPVSAGAPMVA